MKKESVKQFMKSLLPWQLRYYIKLQEAKGNLHIPEGIKWFRPIEQYNEELYDTLRNLGIRNLSGKTVCELGPGHHLSHAFLAYQMGAEKEWLLEIADFAHIDSPASLRDIQLKQGYELCKELPALEEGETWRSYLNQVNAVYSISGLAGYRDVPDQSVDYCVSYDVLEHVRKNIFLETVQQMSRFMRAGGICYHRVDFRDHLNGGKNQLRFSESVWEDEDHYKMGNYTNRIQCSELCQTLRELGFEIISLNRKMYQKTPLAPSKIDVSLANISDEDLLTAEAVIVAKKR